MNEMDTGKRLTIYIGESDSWRGRSLYMSILETLRKNGIAGATVVRGQAGFGAHSLIHTWRIERLSVDLPVIIIVVDTPENIDRALTLVKPMVREGLITLEDIHVIKYTHRHLHSLPADKPVSEIMTRDVTTVTPATPAVRVVELLLGQLFKALPVIDEQRQVVGIITEEDLLEKAGMPARLAVAGRLEAADLRAFLTQVTAELTAQQIMTSPVSTVREEDALGYVVARDIMSEQVLSAPPETTIPDGIALMLREGRKRIVVVDAQQHPVGLVDRQTLLAASFGE